MSVNFFETQFSHRMEVMEEYLETRWNCVVKELTLTNSKEMQYALPLTQLQKNGKRDGVGIAFMDYLNRHVSF